MSRELYEMAWQYGEFKDSPDDDETMDWAAARIRELEQQLAAEKKRRIYYQDIVYSVCNVLDIDDRHSGNVIVCGTAEEPCSDVETRIQQLTAERDSLRQRLAAAQEREAAYAEYKRKLEAIVMWLERNEPSVFARGLWDAINNPPEQEDTDENSSH